MTEKKAKDLVKPEGKAVMTLEEKAVLFPVEGNMEGVVPVLPLISIIHAAQRFALPTASEEDEQVKFIRGIIVDSNRTNAWWEQSFEDTGGGVAPTCFSYDGRVPEDTEGRQAEKCAKCKFNKFGSDRKGRSGKDCKNMRRVHILLEGNEIPFRLVLPPTSLRAYDAYMVLLANVKKNHATVVTEFKLNKNETWSEVTLNAVSDIDDYDTLMGIKKLQDTIIEQMRREEISSDEYEDGTVNPEDKNPGDPY